MDKSEVAATQPRPPNRQIRRLVNLTRYKVTTYNVSLVAEPTRAARFQKYRSTPICSSEDLNQFARLLYAQIPLDSDREHAVALMLNNKNRFEGFKVISTGSLTASVVHPREVFHAAVVLRAAAVAFVHNHPSGDPAPSFEDFDITRRLKKTGDVMGIRFLDHIILGDGRFFSFNDKGKL